MYRHTYTWIHTHTHTRATTKEEKKTTNLRNSPQNFSWSMLFLWFLKVLKLNSFLGISWCLIIHETEDSHTIHLFFFFPVLLFPSHKIFHLSPNHLSVILSICLYTRADGRSSAVSWRGWLREGWPREYTGVNIPFFLHLTKLNLS